jgi:hypothetical protein
MELDSPTITLADFVLERMQIVQLDEKDKIDSVVVLREHQVSNLDKETINTEYIAKITGRHERIGDSTIQSQLTSARSRTWLGPSCLRAIVGMLC